MKGDGGGGGGGGVLTILSTRSFTDGKSKEGVGGGIASVNSG